MERSRATGRNSVSSFSIDRVDTGTWVIRDLTIPPNNADHVVACVEEAEDVGVHVVWVRVVPLPTRYLDVESVVDELRRWTSRRRSEPPIRIPRISPRSRS